MSTPKKITVAILEVLAHRPLTMDMETSQLKHQLGLIVYPHPDEHAIAQAVAKLKQGGYVTTYFDEFEDEYIRITASGRALQHRAN